MNYTQLIARCCADSRRLIHTSFAHDGALAIVRLQEPDRLNALSPTLCWQLRETLQALSQDPALRVLVLTGADPAFCAGGDLDFIASAQHALRDGEEGAVTIWRWIRQQFGGVARLLTGMEAYCIAAINGPAAGVGLAFALACDHRIASERAELVPAFGRIGLVPEVGTSWFLTRMLGVSRALDLYIDGGRIGAARALQLGLVDRVVPHDRLHAAALERAAGVLALPAHTVQVAKRQLRQAADLSWEAAIALEEFAEPLCFTSAAHRATVATLRGPAVAGSADGASAP